MQTYCATLARDERPDWFLAALFTPAREALFALYALDIELAHVRHVAREEMIGYIRYAWWAGRVEALGVGQVPAGHPVLEALLAEKIPAELLTPLIEHYREHYPNPAPDADKLMQTAARELIAERATQSLHKWEKATATIAAHRQKYGHKWRAWLLVRLLFV